MELNEQDPVAVPPAVRLTGVAGQLTFRPATGLTTELRLTPPAKSNALFIETEMEATEAPELKLTGPLTEMEKSPT